MILLMFKIPKEFIGSFILGVIDGDGSFGPNTVILSLGSREFVEDFRLLLKKFNINANVSYRQTKGQLARFGDVFSVRKLDTWTLEFSSGWFNNNEWRCSIYADALKKYPGMISVTPRNNMNYVVNSIVQEDYEDYVYDLQTEDHHFWSNGVVIHNCLYIPLSKLLHHGYSTGHGFLRAPSTIRSASALTCIAIQSSQNDFFNY